MKKKIIISAIFILSMLVATLSAAPSFIVKKIKIEGAKRIREVAIIHNLPLTLGQTFNDRLSDETIKKLYKTGLFDEVHLLYEGNTLIIRVQERSIIRSVKIVGNKHLPEDKLNETLKKLNFKAGAVFDPSVLDFIKQSLVEQYYGMGRFNATIKLQVIPESHRGVSISIDISEGKIAKVEKISFLGNHLFKAKVLNKELALSTSSWLTFFTSKDQYSKEKLNQSIQALQTYYFDRGYIDMRVDSAQVMMTPNKQHVYLLFRLSEGQPYTFSGYELAGNLILPKPVLAKQIQIKPGEIFSRARLLEASRALTNRLGDEGYAFAKVALQPKIDLKNKKVSVVFNIDSGRRYYVRSIYFSGNSITSNIALRNMMTQFEGGLYSTQKVNQSIRNLRQLPYLKPNEISITPIPVKGKENQVDLETKVTEQLSSQIQFTVGYSGAFGLLFGLSLSQNNFLGTGKTAGISFNRNNYQTSYSLSYTDPFFTYEGVSRTTQVYYQITNPGAVYAANYSTNTIGFNDSFGLPLSNYQRLNLGYGFQYLELLTSSFSSKEINNFINQYGKFFSQILLTASWDYNTLDRFQFPTHGDHQSLVPVISVPATNHSLQYYTLTYQNRFYQPLISNLIFTLYGALGYGAGYGQYPVLPFMQNYMAGGIGTLGLNRGYQANTLGPYDSNHQALGGNALADLSLGLIIPTPLDKYNVRTSFFLDAGNVFNTKTGPMQPYSPLAFNNIAYSGGVQVEWWIPIGMPIVFSLAAPLNSVANGTTQIFQFTLGLSF